MAVACRVRFAQQLAVPFVALRVSTRMCTISLLALRTGRSAAWVEERQLKRAILGGQGGFVDL